MPVRFAPPHQLETYIPDIGLTDESNFEESSTTEGSLADFWESFSSDTCQDFGDGPLNLDESNNIIGDSVSVSRASNEANSEFEMSMSLTDLKSTVDGHPNISEPEKREDSANHLEYDNMIVRIVRFLLSRFSDKKDETEEIETEKRHKDENRLQETMLAPETTTTLRSQSQLYNKRNISEDSTKTNLVYGSSFA